MFYLLTACQGQQNLVMTDFLTKFKTSFIPEESKQIFDRKEYKVLINIVTKHVGL